MDFNIEKMAEENGLHVFEIKQILGISLKGECSELTTIKEAWDLYFALPISEARIIVQKKLIELLLAEMDNIKSFDKAVEFYGECFDDEKVTGAVLKRLIDFVKTTKEAKEIFEIASYVNPENEIYLLKKMISVASTSAEIAEVYRETSDHLEEVKSSAFEKVLSFVKTSDQIKDVYLQVYISKHKTLAVEKWLEMSKTLPEVQNIFKHISYEHFSLVLKNMATFYGWEEN